MSEIIFGTAGVTLALGLVAVARRRSPSDERRVYAVALLVAAAIYVLGAMIQNVSIGIEIAGLALFGFAAWIGNERSMGLLGMGWLAHAGWDAWHLVGNLQSPVPDWYAVLCLGFDLVLAAYLVRPWIAKARFSAALSLIIVMAVTFDASGQDSETARPNILFIFSDDHAFQAVSAYGSRLAEVAPTPNIDRLADQGMRFDRAYVTNSICAPSRAVVQTGKYSHVNGVLDNRQTFNNDQPTLPKLLQSAGYETALIGKWHLKVEPAGFDYADRLPGQGHYYNPDFIREGDTVRVEGYVTDITTDKAIDWLESRSASKPFFLMLQQKAPHREWSPPLRHLNLFDGIELPEPDNLFDDYEGRGTAAREQDMSIEHSMFWDLDLKLHDHPDSTRWFRGWRERLTPAQLAAWDEAYGPKNRAFYEAQLTGEELLRWKYQRYLKDYLRTIKAVDEGVGRILDYLDTTGLAANTVVIYTSDQGFYLGEHGWFDKRFMYEESFRTPLLIRWPGVTAGGTVDRHLVANVDFAQTMLEMAGLAEPPDMQGASLVPLLQGESPADWRSHLYYHYYEFPGWHSVRKHEGVFDGRFKLIHFYNLDEWELFDLESDPDEMRSVYSDAAYAEVVDEMKRQLQRLREELEVPPNEAPSGERVLE
jgi:arylsulfatase A-like enzyme